MKSVLDRFTRGYNFCFPSPHYRSFTGETFWYRSVYTYIYTYIYLYDIAALRARPSTGPEARPALFLARNNIISDTCRHTKQFLENHTLTAARRQNYRIFNNNKRVLSRLFAYSPKVFLNKNFICHRFHNIVHQ